MAKLSQSVIFRQPERLYDGTCKKIDQLQLRLKQGMRDAYGQGANQLQGLRHRLEAMSPLHRIERYQDRVLQDKRILTSRMEQVLKEQKVKVQGLSEALLMLDTSRIIARGYAMVKQDDQVLDSVAKVKEGDLLFPHHERWPVRSRGKTCRKKRNLKKILADLEAICPKIWESGQVPLEEAISEFQKGMKLSKDLQETAGSG